MVDCHFQDYTHKPGYYQPVFDVPEDHGTVTHSFFVANVTSLTCHTPQSHSSIVDKDGMAVAITSTVNLVFGSQVMDPVTGIILNDEVRSPPLLWNSTVLNMLLLLDG